MQRRLVWQRSRENGVATIRARSEPGEGGEQPVAQHSADPDHVVRRLKMFVHGPNVVAGGMSAHPPDRVRATTGAPARERSA